jgi:hypothetical protein
MIHLSPGALLAVLVLGVAVFLGVAGILAKVLESIWPGRSWWQVAGTFALVLFVLTLIAVRRALHG